MTPVILNLVLVVGLVHIAPRNVNGIARGNNFADERSAALRTRRSASDIASLVNDATRLEQTSKTLARKLMLQQFGEEETVRASGASGLKSIRLNIQGTKSYYTPVYSDSSFAAMHNHPHTDKTVGMGELKVVLNGVEFTTRHLDYKLVMKSTTSSKYGATEPIPLPEVPPAVLEKITAREQMNEMMDWFRAWRDQDFSVRDYRPYFKPIMCYMEGTWTHAKKAIEESFQSDRHHLDAESWFDMQEKTRFSGYTGSKNILENFAALPTAIMEVMDNGTVVLGQWNFKVLCHPISKDLPTNSMELVDDIATRMATTQSMKSLGQSRAAHFRIAAKDSGIGTEGAYHPGLLDELMEEIPGFDNYMGNIVDDSFDDVAYPLEKPTGQDTPKNAAFFSRWHRSKNPGPTGLTLQHRGFGDENVFVALNTQDKVVGMSVKICEKNDETNCKTQTQKVSYAIPLEIIYMTPMTKWNPYKLKFWGDGNKEGKVAYVGRNGIRRNGKSTPDLAYNGTNSLIFYYVPENFYESHGTESSADTGGKPYNILDPRGNVVKTFASGIRIIMNIKTVGSVRQRYPIVPLHQEGSAVWKGMSALQDIILEPDNYKNMLREEPVASCQCSGSVGVSAAVAAAAADTDDEKTIRERAGQTRDAGGLILAMLPSNAENGEHTHMIMVNAQKRRQLELLKMVTAISTKAYGHSHIITIRPSKKIGKTGQAYIAYYLNQCDGKMFCRDDHPKSLPEGIW